MTEHEVTQLAEAAGLKWQMFGGGFTIPVDRSADQVLVRFAHAVAAKEREACAQVAEREPRVWDAKAKDPQHRIAEAIRARNT